MIEIACINKGRVNSDKNDDCILINRTIIKDGDAGEECTGICVAAVCDGVGGEAHGATASHIVAETLAGYDYEDICQHKIIDIVNKANESVNAVRVSDPEYCNMASTLAALVCNGDRYYVFNAGDSRVYRMNGIYAEQISSDHSMQNMFRQIGVECPQEQRHVITKYIGMDCNVEPYVYEGSILPDAEEIFFLCSDGIWEFIDLYDVEDYINSDDMTVVSACRNIFDRALANGSDDDMSVIIVRIHKD